MELQIGLCVNKKIRENEKSVLFSNIFVRKEEAELGCYINYSKRPDSVQEMLDTMQFLEDEISPHKITGIVILRKHPDRDEYTVIKSDDSSISTLEREVIDVAELAFSLLHSVYKVKKAGRTRLGFGCLSLDGKRTITEISYVEVEKEERENPCEDRGWDNPKNYW